MKSFLNFLSFTIPHILGYEFFFNVFNRSLLSLFISHHMCFIIWVILIILCKIDSCLTHCYSLLEVLNQNLNLTFHQMNFWFEIFDIHMNEKTITCLDDSLCPWCNFLEVFNLYFTCNLRWYIYVIPYPTRRKVMSSSHSMFLLLLCWFIM